MEACSVAGQCWPGERLSLLLSGLFLSLPSSLFSSFLSSLFFFSRTATLSGERSGIGKENIKILRKKKDCKHDGKSSEIKQHILMLLVH